MVRSDGSMLARCATDGPTAMERPFSVRSTATELAWRWRVSSTGAKLAVGPVTGGDGTWNAYRARITVDGTGKFAAKGVDWVDNSTWPAITTATWYYLRLVMDPTANTCALYLATTADRSDETTLFESVAMAGSGGFQYVMIKGDQGEAGSTVDIDDLWWGDPGGGSAPAITSQPASLTILAGASVTFSVTATGDPALLKAFAFGADTWTRTVPGDPSQSYIKIAQSTGDIAYESSRGYGYTDMADIDDSPNDRGVFDGDDEIYDQFIGVKGGEGKSIVFRVDLPQGYYKFVVQVVTHTTAVTAPRYG
jgi:hypothetical protein